MERSAVVAETTSVSRLNGWQAHLYFVSGYTDSESIDRKSRVVGPFAVADAKPPGVPRARDYALIVQIARPERRAHVGAQVVDREVLAIPEKYRDKTFTNLERLALAFGDRADFGDGNEI
jgi:hypothetical protein